MTFNELAAIRRISKLSAASLVRRHGWRRQRDNQGRVIALVPVTWGVAEAGGRSDNGADSEADADDGVPHDEAFQAALAALREAKDSEIATLHGVIDGLRDSAARSVALFDREHARTDRAEQEREAERERAEVAERRADAADTDRRAAQARADALQAEAALRDAEVNAAAARADHAEAAAAGERARTDALRDRLDAMQAEREAAQTAAELARRHAQEAQDTAEALRQAEAARRARGRLRRAWAAWRGE